MCSSYIQNRENIERLEITGVGDPSGRGLGFSYVRATPKAPITNSVVKRKAVVSKGSTVTGTDADLRRLSMEAAREVCWVLLCKFFVAPKCSYILKLVDSILAFEMLKDVWFLLLSCSFYNVESFLSDFQMYACLCLFIVKVIASFNLVSHFLLLVLSVCASSQAF